MRRAGPAGGHVPDDPRRAALAGAALALDAELARAPVDEQFALVLRACAHGGYRALRTLCDRIDDPRLALREAPAVALVQAVAEDEASARAVRAAAWMMVAQRVAETWPATWFDVLTVAREAMPLRPYHWESVRQLTALTAGALLTEDAGDREGMHFQFSRESLETVIDAATGRRPVRRDMIDVISHWTACFLAGIKACDERLSTLERASSAIEREAPGA
jgi:hypothetical protein